MLRRTLVGLAIATAVASGSGSQAITPDEANTVAAIARVAPSVVFVLVSGIEIDAANQRIAQIEVSGSGFAVETGLVVTNYHVIANARRIEVVLQDGSSARAAVVGTAPELDIALLRVPFGPTELPAAELGSVRDLEVGHRVLVVSSPLGLQSSVSLGIVSGLDRELPGLELGRRLIQFDAPINPGQSGGPLADSRGRVVGITTAKVFQAEALGFAIPIDLVRRTVPDLQSMGHAFRPHIGLKAVGVDPDLARLLDLPAERGVLVEEVEPGSVAERIGLTPGHRRLTLGDREFVLGGDIIVAVNGEPIRAPFEFLDRFRSARAGESLELTVQSATGMRTLTLVIPEMEH